MTRDSCVCLLRRIIPSVVDGQVSTRFATELARNVQTTIGKSCRSKGRKQREQKKNTPMIEFQLSQARYSNR
jgi:hypothetical protein